LAEEELEMPSLQERYEGICMKMLGMNKNMKEKKMKKERKNK